MLVHSSIIHNKALHDLTLINLLKPSGFFTYYQV